MKNVILAVGGGALILVPVVLLAKARVGGYDEGAGVLALVYLAVAVTVCVIAIQIKRRAEPGIFGLMFDKLREKQNPAPPGTPATQIIPRKCPQCGAELKPDVSEGLCPACLLQRGIATEGGAPPGTPPFVPPTIPDLARLFPQLEILELIGQGGMGAVYKARQPALDRFVALKILAPRSGDDRDFAGRFTREARALAKLSHPNIVGVYDFGIVGQASSLSPSEKKNLQSETGKMPVPLHYFIMEYMDGPNLRQVEQAGKLSPREALEIVPQICAALQFAHDEGIVHRDIKPENVLLDKKGRVKIADFGLAKILGQEPKDFRLTGARDVMGTPHYMAPEQIEKPQTVDHRADIYSLGVVFYEMLTGELPLGKFQPPSSCVREVQIDVRLDEVVLRSLEKEPARRYQQVSEVKTRVETIANSQGGPAANAGATPNPSPGRDYRTKQSFFGLPLVHVAWGVDPVTHRPRVAKGLLAVGPKAKGLIAVGLEAYGLMAAGLIAGGIFPVGLLAFGVLSVGLVAYGIVSTGLLAIALIHCVGLVSLGNHSVGLVHFGIDAPVFFLLGLPIAAIWFLQVICSTIKRAWQSAGQPAAATSPPPDQFWRRFAVVLACVVLIPVAIAILGLLAAIAIPNFVRARQQSQQLAAQQWTQQGWQLWRNQEMEKAAAKFQQAVQLAPDDAEAWNGLGWATFNSGKSQEAEQAFQKAISLDTNQPGALNGLGQIYLSRRLYDQAEMYLLKAAPQAPAAWYGLTRLYLLEGKFDRAERWAQKLVDSGQADDLARQMLTAAQEKHLSEGLRFRIEPPPATNETGSTPAGPTSVNSVSASAAVESAADRGQTVAGLPPVVVETWPVSGARDIEPGVAEIRVRFSKEMADGGWSWSTAWENSTPEIIGQIHYEPDQRTCVLQAKLEPGRTYAYWLNSEKFRNFTDRGGRAAVPYLLIFQTKQN